MRDPQYCKLEGCGGRSDVSGTAHGYCVKHYKQEKRGTLGKTAPRFIRAYDVSFKVEAEMSGRIRRAAKHLGLTWSGWWRKAAERKLQEDER